MYTWITLAGQPSVARRRGGPPSLPWGASEGSVASLRRAREGFTLIELLLVVVIIGILAAMVVPSIIGRADEARVEAARADLKVFSDALDQYQMHVGKYPTTDEGLAALLSCPASVKDATKWKGPYLKATSVPKDPWGGEYVYKFPSERGLNWPDVYCMGPDGQPNTEDDIFREK